MTQPNTTTIGEIADLVRGVTYQKADARKTAAPGYLPVLRATNIGAGLDFDDLVYVPESNVADDQLLRTGDSVIAASSGSASVVGKAATLLKEWRGAFGAFCMVARPDARFVDPLYLSSYLQTSKYRSEVSRLAAGVNINNLRREHVAGIEVPIVALSEQRRIVAAIESYFSRLDAAVATLERVQRNLDRYRASVLKAAVEGCLVPTEAELARKEGRTYEPASELLKRILVERRHRWEEAELAKLKAKGQLPKDDRWKAKYEQPIEPSTAGLPRLPDGWCWATLDQLLFGIEAGNSFRCREIPPGPGETGVVKVSAVTWGQYDEDESKTCTDARLVDDDLLIAVGDLLISRANTLDLVGACVIAQRVTRRVMLSDKILRLVVADDVKAWMLWCLRSRWGREQIQANATGNQLSMRNIGQDGIRSIAMPIPPARELVRIVEAIESSMSVASHSENALRDSMVRVSRLRQSILSWAFSGCLVERDPTDEPASVLLDRIRAERAATKPVSAARGRRRKEPVR